MIKFDIKNWWDNLQPKNRRYIVVGSFCSVIAMAILLSPEDKEAPKPTTNDSLKRSVLTSGNTRDLGIEALSAKSRKQEKKTLEIEKKIDNLTQSVKDLHERRGDTTDAQLEIQNLNAQLQQINQLLKQQGWKIEDIQDGYVGPQPNSTVSPQTGVNPSPNQNSQQPSLRQQPSDNSSDYYFNKPVQPAVEGPEISSDGKSQRKFVIARIEEKQPEKNEDDLNRTEIVLPSGSIMSGTLLNGMDAPAGAKASANPYPAIVRIQKDAILPNLFTSDVRECLITMSGFGQLSTERVDMRGERMSCITEDEKVIDVEINAYVIGDDGKVGVRGTLVHRTGALLANTLMAGTLSGLGEALSANPIPTISTGNRQEYQAPDSSALQYGVSSGFGKGFEKLSDYWLELAEQIFPVIEVEAARQVDVALTGKLILTPRK